MKKSMKSFVAGFLAAILLIALGTVVYAGVRTQTITVTYNNIRLVVNGELRTPTDARGNIVEPFLFEGTTFLPVRALAEALGQRVHWDAATATVYVGEIPATAAIEVMLFDRPHVDVGYVAGFAAEGTSLANTIRLWGSESSDIGSGRHISSNYVVYPLNMTATIFRATLNPPALGIINAGSPELTYRIYGDGRLLYASPGMTANVAPIPIEVDVSGVIQLRIEAVLTATTRQPSNNLAGWIGNQNTHRGLENARIVTTDF